MEMSSRGRSEGGVKRKAMKMEGDEGAERGVEGEGGNEGEKLMGSLGGR